MNAPRILIYLCVTGLLVGGDRTRTELLLNRYQGDGAASLIRGRGKYFFPVESIEVHLGTLNGNKTESLRETISWAVGTEELLQPILVFRLQKMSGADTAINHYLVQKLAGMVSPASRWPQISVRMKEAKSGLVLQYHRPLDQHDLCTTGGRSAVDDVWLSDWLSKTITTNLEYSIEIDLTAVADKLPIGQIEVVLQLRVAKHAP